MTDATKEQIAKRTLDAIIATRNALYGSPVSVEHERSLPLPVLRSLMAAESVLLVALDAVNATPTT